MKSICCVICKTIFTPKPMGYNAIYCSKNCSQKNYRMKHPEKMKEQRKRSYKNIKDNPEKYKTHQIQSNNGAKKIRNWLAEYKENIGCVDCGYNIHFSALQIDHQGEKTASISEIRSSKEGILKEIELGDCRVRCANCHSVKTWAEKNKITYIPGMAQDKNLIPKK